MSPAALARRIDCGALRAHNIAALAAWLVAACGIGAGAALGLPYLASPAPAAAVLPGTPVSGFALSAPDGSIVSPASLRGAPYVLLFGYTRCGMPCRARIARVLGWRAQIGSTAAALPVVVVSVDPAYDSPARMGAFAASLPEPVLALTGSAPAVTRAARSFGAVYFKAALCGGGTIISHSSAAYLVGRDGRARAIIAQDENPASARARLRALLAA